jgi:hypothetical protein
VRAACFSTGHASAKPQRRAQKDVSVGVCQPQNDRLGRNLERLAEGFLRFVVLVAVAFVELVGALADHV